MSQVRPVVLNLLTAAVWLIFPVLFAVIGYATFIVPTTVGTLQVQGITQIPVRNQLLVDLSDLCKNRWFVVFPLLIVLAVATSRFLGRLRDKDV